LIEINKPSMRVYYELQEEHPGALQGAIVKAIE
jgi:hypothetical protein